eukprot:5603667-Pyramimonas_sp.AAC.1
MGYSLGGERDADKVCSCRQRGLSNTLKSAAEAPFAGIKPAASAEPASRRPNLGVYRHHTTVSVED